MEVYCGSDGVPRNDFLADGFQKIANTYISIATVDYQLYVWVNSVPVFKLR